MSKTYSFRKNKKQTGKTKKTLTNESGYCMKCKKKQSMKNCTIKKNMLKGVCPVCGTKMNRFIKMR